MNSFPRDKFERYKLFSKLFRRELIRIDFDGSSQEKEKFEKFIASHEEYMLKPVVGTKGHGVEKHNSDDFKTPDELKSSCAGAVILEELITQGEEMASFHPASINSCRFVSVINDKGEVSPLFVTIRTGRGGSVVDNVGAGGITALVDANTGVVCSDGLCEYEYFEKHPDTGVRYKGFRLPNYSELCSLVADGHKLRPQQKFIGWDFAWTDKGEWDCIEVNPGPAFISYQKLSGKGIRDLLKSKGVI
ncbi:MAG: sugar-transfer associated ATP-grasp domain-containing protein [Clostridia bacterium]|nr:sugar-transfer associated ATP-grasp domain-containing protein [Clostridia bacterium]